LLDDFSHPVVPVDNFVDNADESSVRLALKTPGQPRPADMEKIKLF
jgi:hypothetical protein